MIDREEAEKQMALSSAMNALALKCALEAQVFIDAGALAEANGDLPAAAAAYESARNKINEAQTYQQRAQNAMTAAEEAAQEE